MHRLHRRTFLTGLGGATVALPFLEAMLPRGAWAAAGAPLRYVGMFGGVEQRDCVPSGTGAGYTMPDGFASLEPVRDLVTIVSNLVVPPAGAGSGLRRHRPFAQRALLPVGHAGDFS